jgi:hypothetical protein
MHSASTRSPLYQWVLVAAFIVTTLVYWPGLRGAFLFDDYPNIVDNQGIQPHDADVASLVRAAMSSPASDFKRPLASLSFAANYIATGLDPYWMKFTNLLIHLLNGLLVFLLARALLQAALSRGLTPTVEATALRVATKPAPLEGIATEVAPATADQVFERDFSDSSKHASIVAALIATGWMLLPINLTGVLYVVQRMESLANLFVLLGLIGYVVGRRRMLGDPPAYAYTRGFILCLISITVPVLIGVLAKETAVMLPLYALLIEWMLFRFRKPPETSVTSEEYIAKEQQPDIRIASLFLLVLVLPMVMGLAWLLPGLLRPETWAVRDFTLNTRLLSEARIIVDYIVWTLMPTPGALSFYHDDFHISSGLLAPWSTLASIVFLAALIALMLWLRTRQPVMALGITLFLGCQLLTGTILPLELIYEHRNYFASFGLLLAIMPLLAVPRATPFALPRYTLLFGLILFWTTLTALTAHAWGNPLRLAEDLASRAPLSPRAQYELGRTYIIYSNYDPTSPFTALAYAPLEQAAALPGSSILPEQALIFMSARMRLPLKDAWWSSMVAKLRAHQPGVQDESSLAALTQCAREQRCDLPRDRMMESFMAALNHAHPSARLLATYGDYAWNVLDDHVLGVRMTKEAVETSPNEPAYQITLIRMLLAQGRMGDAEQALQRLQPLNIGGRLNVDLNELRLRMTKTPPG